MYIAVVFSRSTSRESQLRGLQAHRGRQGGHRGSGRGQKVCDHHTLPQPVRDS